MSKNKELLDYFACVQRERFKSNLLGESADRESEGECQRANAECYSCCQISLTVSNVLSLPASLLKPHLCSLSFSFLLPLITSFIIILACVFTVTSFMCFHISIFERTRFQWCKAILCSGKFICIHTISFVHFCPTEG